MLVDELKKIIQINNRRELRKFGFTVGIFVCIIAVVVLFFLGDLGIYLLFLGIILILLAIFNPMLLKPVFLIWMSFLKKVTDK